jgi:predicted alternative tryptophan synthase beta-subunit
MIGAKLRGEGFEKTRFVAAESAAAPKLTKGEYRYDFPDATGILPLIKMYTLGRDYVPPPVHAAGLRYHGAAPSLSLLKRLGLVEAVAYSQEEVMQAALLFARSEGVIPAPESAHAVKAAADLAKKLPPGSVIVFNMSGHGLLDVDAYEKALEWVKDITT